MPVIIDNQTFTDVFGNATTFWKANAGDEVTAVFNIRSQQRVTSAGNPLTLDAPVHTVQSPNISWIEEGFRPGQWVYAIIYTSGGAVDNTFWTQLVTCDDITADFGSMADWYDITAGESMAFFPVTGNGSTQVLARDDMDVLFNNPKNSIAGNEFSLIDGETTRFLLQDLVNNQNPGDTVNGIIAPNQSGAFVKSVSIETQAPAADGWFRHDLTVVFTNPGQYDDGSFFFSSECLKAFLKIEWAMEAGEPYARAVGKHDLQANSGGYNEAFNTLPINSALVQGVQEIDYCVPSTFDIIVDGPVTDLGIGAAYESIDEAYFKNRPESQYGLTMIIPTAPLALGTLNSEVNPDGAAYSITVNSITTVLTETTINVTFTPNAEFTEFFTNTVEDGDRLFNLWIRCGNVNLLAYSEQLTCEPPVGGPLAMVQDYGYLNHSENVETAVGNSTGFIADTEDDVAYLGTFLLDKNVIYDSFSAKIEAFNVATEEDFTLQIVNFSLGSIPFDGSGALVLDETAATVSTLPNTSVKLNARLTREPSLDTPTQYGVKIYVPWLLNWKYWLTQTNANDDFYPNKNKNWEQYDNVGSWEVRTELALINGGLAFTHSNRIFIRDYDAEGLIDSEIQLRDIPTTNIIGVIPQGQTVQIKSMHINNFGIWDQGSLWGMITVEPFEGGPRWICSTVVPFDNNTNNPLTPISGLVITPVFTALNTVELDCYLDSTKIDVSNGVKITAKIHSGKDVGPLPISKTTSPTDNDKNEAGSGNNKELAP